MSCDRECKRAECPGLHSFVAQIKRNFRPHREHQRSERVFVQLRFKIVAHFFERSVRVSIRDPITPDARAVGNAPREICVNATSS